MTRNELVATLAQRFPALTRADVTEYVNLLLAAMAEAIAAGRRIEIRGFGNFCLHFRPPRYSRNPKTGAKLKIPGKWTPHFRSGKTLREAVGPGSTTALQEALPPPRMNYTQKPQPDASSGARSSQIEASQ